MRRQYTQRTSKDARLDNVSVAKSIVGNPDAVIKCAPGGLVRIGDSFTVNNEGVVSNLSFESDAALSFDGVLTANRINFPPTRVDLDTEAVGGVYSITDETTSERYNFVATTTGYIITLPDATVVPRGWSIRIGNSEDSTAIITVADYDGNYVIALRHGEMREIHVHKRTTPAGVWFVDYYEDSSIVYVGRSGCQYTSIKEAMDAITDASASNKYLLWIANGEYTEDPITVKQYVSIVSNEHAIIHPTTNTDTLFTLSDEAYIRGIEINGCDGTGGIGVLIDNVDTCYILDCNFVDCETCLRIQSDTTDIIRTFLNCCKFSLFPTDTSTYSIYVDGTNATLAQVQFRNCLFGAGATGTTNLALVGGNAFATASSCIFASDASIDIANTGTAISILDSATFTMLGSYIFRRAKAIYVSNSVSTPTLNITGSAIQFCTADIDMACVNGSGSVNMTATGSKCTILSDNVSVFLSDPTGPTIMPGDVYLGDTFATAYNATAGINHGIVLGLYHGGELTDGGGLTLNVAEGYGYVDQSEVYKKLEWSSDTLTLDNNSTLWIYISFAGTLTQNTAKPDTWANVILGRVRTDGSDISFIDNVAIQGDHFSNAQDLLNLEVLQGAIFGTGCVVSDGGSNTLNVSNGVYHYSARRYTPSGATPATFDIYFRDGSGGWNIITAQTTYTVAQYDNNGGALTAIPAGEYAEHALYLVNDGVNQKFFLITAQSTHAAVADVELPAPPSYFEEGVVKLAGIIVQQGVGLNSITDERPIFGGSQGAVAAVGDHGGLTGLGDDDHTQYLLTNGTRAVSGNMSMGGNRLTDVILSTASFYDGVGQTFTIVPTALVASRNITLPQLSADDTFVFANHAQTLTNKTLTTPRINDTSSSHQYVVNVEELTANRNVLLPLLTADDTFAFVNHSQSLTNKTLTDASNLIGATELRTTGASVDVVSAAPPSADQFLRATSATAATWQTYIPALTNSQATATTAAAITSATYVLITGMSLTGLTGTYLVSFSATGTCNTDAANALYAIYNAGTIVSHTVRSIMNSATARAENVRMTLHTQAILTGLSAATVDVRAQTSTGTFTIDARSLVAVRIA